MGVESRVFDPCGNVPNDEDFMSVMNRNKENLKTLFKNRS
jgi:hypothetical protein